MILTLPRVVENIGGRWYIQFDFLLPSGVKKRKRIYSFRQISIPESTYGNRKDASKQDKRIYFGLLLQTVNQKIKDGWVPIAKENTIPTAEELLLKTKTAIDSQGVSVHHHKNLVWITKKLSEYLGRKKQLKKPFNEIFTKHLMEEFLDKLCDNSNGYFNSARKQLSALFGIMIRKGLLEDNPVKSIHTRKHTPQRNSVYSPSELLDVLRLCQLHFPNLYLAMLFEFQLLLRPHKEIRLLKRGMFSESMDLLSIPEGYTKGRRGRHLPVSPIIVEEMLKRNINKMGQSDNVFTGTEKPFNPYYFSTQWQRFKKLAEEEGIVKVDQTLYSLRHSAALQIYKKKNSIEAVKKAMDHTKILTTFEYLRGLGIREKTIELNDLPELFL